MEGPERYEADVNIRQSENPRNEPLKIEDLEEKKLFKKSSSSDSRIDTKSFLRKAFMEKLFEMGVTCKKMKVQVSENFELKNFIIKKDTLVYSKCQFLPLNFAVVFGFDAISAESLINNVQENCSERVIVFNGVDLQNIESLKSLAASKKSVLSVIWLDANNYPDILPLYEAAIAIEKLKSKEKMHKQMLRSTFEEFGSQLEEFRRQLEESRRQSEESRRRMEENEIKLRNKVFDLEGIIQSLVRNKN